MKQIITYGSRQLNQLVDDTLMQKLTFPSQTLMELAGLAVAQISESILHQLNINKVCVLVGPGNNGGDGLVAARHLKMMNYAVDLVLFKTLKGKCENLYKLCECNGIKSKIIDTDFGKPETPQTQSKFTQYLSEHDFIIDGIFGFPFTGQIRQPYKYFLPLLHPFSTKILSIDIPSGWDANEGNIHNLFTPQYLVSLSIPKKSCQNFKGDHYLGGRFIPQSIQKQLNIVLPSFPRSALFIQL